MSGEEHPPSVLVVGVRGSTTVPGLLNNAILS